MMSSGFWSSRISIHNKGRTRAYGINAPEFQFHPPPWPPPRDEGHFIGSGTKSILKIQFDNNRSRSNYNKKAKVTEYGKIESSHGIETKLPSAASPSLQATWLKICCWETQEVKAPDPVTGMQY